MSTWRAEEPPPRRPVGATGWIRVAGRGAAIGTLTFGCLGLLLAVRLIERPLFGLRRPATPYITRFVCRNALRLMGLRLRVVGSPMRGHGALVANHCSWIDIFALNACDLVYFVAKSEVAGWAGIGWLARATGTLFIRRDGREAADQLRLFEKRLDAGHRLLFFPEGTSTSGRLVLSFKTTLFEAFFRPHLRATCAIQPVTVAYEAPPGADQRVYAWWGDMDFGSHLVTVLALPSRGDVTVMFHDPIDCADARDRKDLALRAERAVREGLNTVLNGGPKAGSEV